MKPLPGSSKARFTAFAVRSLRVCTYLAVVGCVTGVVGTRVVRAQAETAALGIGEKMLGLELGEGARELVLNGQHLRVSTAHTSMPLHDVLDRLTDACRKDADGLAGGLVDLPRALEAAPSSARPAGTHGGIGLLRDERDGRGVVSCFATGEDSTLGSVRARLGKFIESHDLADVGQLRYMAARTLPEGGTLVVSTWSEGPLALDALFPEAGDAPGDDPALAPRPGDARRILSLHAAPAPYGMFVYATGASAPVALADYDRAIVARHFVRYEATAARGGTGRAYRNGNGNVDVLVSVSADEAGKATLSVVETSSRMITRALTRSVTNEGAVK